jgi:uncharacterized protein (DUF2126 family)
MVTDGHAVSPGKSIIETLEDELDSAIASPKSPDDGEWYDAGYTDGLALAIAIMRNPYQDKIDDTIKQVYEAANARVDSND